MLYAAFPTTQSFRHDAPPASDLHGQSHPLLPEPVSYSATAMAGLLIWEQVAVS